MPRKKAARGASSAFHQVQQQARTLLVKLRKDIRSKESILNKLREEERRLGALIGRGGGSKAISSGPRGRVDWRTVLSALPKQFKASDVRNVRGLKGKRPSEIFAAITRWIDAGAAKRKARGVYERV
jgi:hypothetical protein